jgi:hypothetical protein
VLHKSYSSGSITINSLVEFEMCLKKEIESNETTRIVSGLLAQAAQGSQDAQESQSAQETEA